MLINLARHADHHLTPSKRYQVLDTLDTAPQLAAGEPELPRWRSRLPDLWGSAAARQGGR